MFITAMIMTDYFDEMEQKSKTLNRKTLFFYLFFFLFFAFIRFSRKSMLILPLEVYLLLEDLRNLYYDLGMIL